MDSKEIMTSEKHIEKLLCRELLIKPGQAQAVIKLIDEGNTIPFIARYRKEATGDLGDEKLRVFEERLKYLRGLWERKEAVLRSIDEQGKLTEDIKRAVEEADSLVKLEDIYRPYKQKRKTRAAVARERGLEPLAAFILSGGEGRSLNEEAEKYLSPEKEICCEKGAVSGALDIIAGMLSDSAALRQRIRDIAFKKGVISSRAKDETAQSVYETYYDFSEPVKKIAGHRILALDRGEREKALTVKLEGIDEESMSLILQSLMRMVPSEKGEIGDDIKAALREAAGDAYRRLIAPSIENEVRSELTQRAGEGAIKVFSDNLRQLIMQPPLREKTVLGWDPAFRTGCKLAVVDKSGKVLHTEVIYPTPPQNRVEEAYTRLEYIAKRFNVEVISLGNGTASRESERIIADFIKRSGLPISYAIVNEAGASVYSASRQGAEEFPGFDVGERSAVSIARRLQDPLAELVKIEPESIGVGQYQHDLNKTRLSEALKNVVEDCVNSVGVDVNTASASLLEYVSGINKTTAKNIVAYRDEHGSFTNRRELMKVDKLGEKTFRQAAGFLRISGGDEPLDRTAVHPESYGAAKRLFEILGIDPDSREGKPGSFEGRKELRDIRRAAEAARGGLRELSETLGVGEYTLRDIIVELEKPGRDPRDELEKPLLKSDVMEMKDLRAGMVLKGTVRNVTDFGAFVDIGVHQDGLVHISELSDKFIKHPSEAVKVGDIVEVRVLSADPSKGRIALSMKKG